MAENNATKSRNQAFLEQHERQRLNKLCNRTIDLRGKVAGECQAYQFGGKTHYLDDRAYLLAKQLLDRFDGRYTWGVYEALLKALKSLSFADNNPTANQADSILKRDKSQVQLIPLDRQLHRQESRIIFATPVEIRIADVLYHAATLDISTSAISVTLKRTFALNKGDLISVNFPDLAAEQDFKLLSKIHYKILVIDHDELRTRLILVRDRKDNNAITQQLDRWCKQHNSPEYLDLDNVLFNLACRYYRRLYCRTLTSPQFWLDSNDKHDPIKAFQLVPTAESTLFPLQQEKDNIDLSLLPFSSILREQCDFLLQISGSKVHIAQRSRHSQITALLNHHAQQTPSHVLLITCQNVDINVANFENEIACVATNDPDYAENLEQRLNAIDSISSVTNITACCSLLESSTAAELNNAHAPWQGKLITPTDFGHTIKRDKLRFLIRTSIQMHADNTAFKTTTMDVSTTGLSFNLPGKVALTIGSKVSVDFIRWQSQTTTLKLTKLIYIVRNCHFWSGATRIGLERENVSATPSINRFFNSTLKRNKEQLVTDHQHTIISQESRIFGAVLGQHLATTLFYLGMDDDNKRILQAVSSAKDNQKESLWLALQSLVTMMSELLKSLANNTSDSIHFGVYCYQDKQETWQLSTDHNFSSISQKSVFINRAIVNEHHYFFHCRLCPIKSTWLDQETDLNQQLLDLRNHSPHKVKQIRSVLHSLFAVGELTDITDIVSTNYQHLL